MFRHLGAIAGYRTRAIMFVGLSLLIAMAVSIAQGSSNPAANLDQCANGPLSGPVHCNSDPTQWVNGNLNGNQAHFFEGDSIPYRMRFSGLGTGAGVSHTVTIGWDTTKGGKHAFDYLTSFDRTETTADPCSGVAGCGSPTTFAIPPDGNFTAACTGCTQVPGVFTLYNGLITSVSGYTLTAP